MEIRTLSVDYGQSEDMLEGIAIRFNSVSEVMYDGTNKRYFREVISPDAITDELINASDIFFTINHDKKQTVARSRNGKGSLAIEKREEGVYFVFQVPDTTIGHDLREMVKRGDISNCSFAYSCSPEDVQWDFTNRAIPTRTVTHIRGLYDLSAVFTPAFSQTEITARSLDEMMPKEETEIKEEPKDEKTEERQTTETLEMIEVEESIKKQEEVEKREEQKPEDDSWKAELEAYRQRLN